MAADGTIDLANTHVFAHAGRVFALMETSGPTEIGSELDTVGRHDFAGRLSTPMTAHPKRCPQTGEVHFFGYGFVPPYLTYHRVDAAGSLVQTEVIDVPGATMIHDFALTQNHVVFFDLPVVFDFGRFMEGTMPYRWSDSYGARLGVMPRGGAGRDVKWYEVTPGYAFHTVNAFEQEDRIVIDVVRYDELWRGSPNQFAPAALHRWTIDQRRAVVLEEALDDRAVEFPRADDRLVGLPYRFCYTLQAGAFDVTGPVGATSLYKHDLARGTVDVHEFGPGRMPGEGVFVPASPDGGEDEGYVMTYVYDARRETSDFVILDARDFRGAPIATVRLPQRVPFGFHGSWVADA
jgi:carotenoid cleavage dioxygenase